MTPPTLRIGAWNTEWAKPDTPRGNRVRDALAAPGCDILCVTEGFAGILPHGGHVIDADPDYGYPIHEGRRKVLLWSQQPWTDVDALGSEELPSGRFVAGATQTPVGPLTVVGVCIPWGGAHVTSGTKDRERWEDHLAWLSGFEIATAGELPEAPGLAIDHIAHTADLAGEKIGLWHRRTVDDQPFSDHFGVWCDLRPAD